MSLQIQNSVNLLYPKFYNTLHKAIENASALGYDIFIFETYRSPERQDHLYSQVPKVTDAKAWMSWHQYGLAVDLVFGGPGKWSWKGDWEGLATFMQARGLRWIGMKDAGHFEHDHDLSIFEAKQIALKTSVLEVWRTIESKERVLH